ncbi:hypothetical protein FOA52_002585 [Chlamydomonas sp. UWO 241]|nr:hypothetical protein FOA52_002585 [Chlamydomonas sp. UWO 241]
MNATHPAQPLWDAAGAGDVAALRLLLPSADPDIAVATDEYGSTALMIAARNGHAEAMRLLLDRKPANAGAMLVAADGHGRTPLVMAAAGGHVDAMRLLLEHPFADAASMLETPDSRGRTALTVAAMHGHVDAMRLLVDHPSANPADLLMRTDSHGDTALMLAAWRGHVDAMLLLLDHPAANSSAMVMHRNSIGPNALMLAACSGHVGAMRLLLDHPSADPVMMKHTNTYGSTALMMAARNGHVEAMRVLLDHPSADAAAMLLWEDSRGDTALMLAAAFAAGAPTLDTSKRSCAPLMLLMQRVADLQQECAALRAQMTAVMTTLCQGPRSEQIFGEQPDKDRDNCVRLLLECGADMFDPNVARCRTVVTRLTSEAMEQSRLPQTINEAIVGLAHTGSQMRTAVVRTRIPGWLRLVDASIVVASLCWSIWAVYTFHTADALALCVATCAALVSVLSPRYSLEAHCFVPIAWSVVVLAAAFAAELAWSKLDTGVFALAEKLAMNFFFKSPGRKAVPALLLFTVFKITTILLCTESGPSRRAVSCYQACASVASHLLLNGMLGTHAAFGFPIDATLQTEMAMVAATECSSLLLLLLTPKAVPTRARGKSSTTAGDQPTSSASAPTDTQANAGLHAPANDTMAMARAAVPVAPTTCDGAQQPKYHSRTLNRSVAFTVKFPEQASLQRGAPVSLRVMQLSVGAGCVVVHGRVFGNGTGVRASSDEVAAMLRAMCVSDVLMRLLQEGARLLDEDTAVLQLGDGAPLMELAFNAADGRFLEAPRSDQPPPVPLPGVPLLSATWPLLALPASGSGRVHLQVERRAQPCTPI